MVTACSEIMDEYIAQVIKLAEKLSELICLNLGLEKTFIKEAFSGSTGPSVGTKFAKYPEFPQPELVIGLREHFDAGGIIVMLQDDHDTGLEFLIDGQGIKVPPKKDAIFVNIGDQLKVLSNGRYRSALHRGLTYKTGSRPSMATFHDPAGDALISPPSKLLYPTQYRFQDYLKIYSTTKFLPNSKSPRLQAMKTIANGNQNLPG